MNRTNMAAYVLALALTATASGSAFGADRAGWAVGILDQNDGGNLIVPAAFKSLGPGNRIKHGNSFKRGPRFKRRPNRVVRRHRRRRLDRPFVLFAVTYSGNGYYVPAPYVYPYVTAPTHAPSADPTPTPDQSSDCREVVMDVIVGGIEQKAYGTVCEQVDGTWKVSSRMQAESRAPEPAAAVSPRYCRLEPQRDSNSPAHMPRRVVFDQCSARE